MTHQQAEELRAKLLARFPHGIPANELLYAGYLLGVSDAVKVVEGGRFLHDTAPPRMFANEVVMAIRRECASVDSPPKCDGNHGGPRCGDPECWNDTPPVMQDGICDMCGGNYLGLMQEVRAVLAKHTKE